MRKLILILIGLLVFPLVGCQKTETPVSTPAMSKQDQTAEVNTDKNKGDVVPEKGIVLPQTERSEDSLLSKEDQAKVPVDPFSGPVSLKGIIRGSGTDDLAIIEAGGTSYIASPGDNIATYWKLEKVDHHSVVLRAGERELVLVLPNAANGKNGGASDER